MKKKIFPILCVAALMASCELETSDNGDLDGNWRMQRVDTLATGGTADLMTEKRYWGIDHKLIWIRDYAKDYRGYYCRFDHSGDSLRIYDPYANHGHEDSGQEGGGGDIPVTDFASSKLNIYGLSGLSTSFKVESLTGSRMVLTSKTVKIYFKKM